MSSPDSLNRRLLARLDIKGENVIKGIQMEGLRIVGRSNQFATKYYEDAADELFIIDSVASLYNRESILRVIEITASSVYIPITCAGGVRTVENARQLLNHGADKIALNTAAIANPSLLTEIANIFGNQSVVLSVEAKRFGADWELMANFGRERTGILLGPWLESAEENGAGEVLVTSVDNDGTRQGLDLELMTFARTCTDLPLIGSGGIGIAEHVTEAFLKCNLDGIAIASALHYSQLTIEKVKLALIDAGLKTRVRSNCAPAE